MTRVSAGGAAPGQSIKTFVGKVALSASAPTTQPLYTVTAGKSLLITDVFISHDSATVLDTRLQANSVDLIRAPIKGDTAPLTLMGIESQPTAVSGAALQIVWPIAAGAPNGFFFVAGIES